MLVPQEKLPDYLYGSLLYAGITWNNQAKLLESAATAYCQVASRGYYHLPFYFIYDLHALIHLGYEASFVSDSGTPRPVETTTAEFCSRYEREVLGRLLQSPDFGSALELISTSGQSQDIAKRLLLLLADRFQHLFPQGPIINPAQVRQISAPYPGDIHPETALENLGDPAHHLVPALEQFLEQVTDSIRWGHLLSGEDFFELTHLEVLKDDHLRIGCRQLIQLNRDLAEGAELKLDLSTHESDADTSFVDETHYPSGGLTGLTNRGSFENLVMSELIYMEESPGEVSLFNLRYVEGELLFYLRDSGILRRKRRTIHLVIDLGDLFQVKSTSQRYQYCVLAQGFCLRLLHDFFAIFEKDSLRFVFHYLPSPDSAQQEDEQLILRTLLQDYIQHGWVRFENRKALDLTSLPDPKRKSYAMILTHQKAQPRWMELQEALKQEAVPLHSSVLALDATGADEITRLRGEVLQELLA